ncbi:MAG: DUF4350 domain-containing protein [Proteobacteria bacterium]|nr:DUF4350 domain-containing protein [Pseudomonadota bacterium]
MTRLRATLLVILVLVAAGGLGTWWWQTHERIQQWIDLPQRGEVTYNPLYVLKLALRGDGVQVQSRQRLQLDEVSLGARDTLVLLNDPRRLSQRETTVLLDWISQGGHLLVRTPPPSRFQAGDPVPLLQGLGVRPRTDETPECIALQVPGEPPHSEFCQGRRFDLGDATAGGPRWGNDGAGYVYARLAHGAGHVDVLADLDFLGNEKLEEGPHIALTRQLLAPNYRAGTVHLVYAAQMPSLWMLLLRHSWMAWLPLGLLLIGWLWRRMQRFGPELPSPAVERRSLLEHIGASGEHAYRYGYAHLLHAAARDAFMARLRRSDPQAAALEGAVQVGLIAERLQRPHAEIRDALATPAAGDHAAFRARIATLIRLRNQL